MTAIINSEVPTSLPSPYPFVNNNQPTSVNEERQGVFTESAPPGVRHRHWYLSSLVSSVADPS